MSEGTQLEDTQSTENQLYVKFWNNYRKYTEHIDLVLGTVCPKKKKKKTHLKRIILLYYKLGLIFVALTMISFAYYNIALIKVITEIREHDDTHRSCHFYLVYVGDM